MTRPDWINVLARTIRRWQQLSPARQVLIAAALFWGLALLLQAWRLLSLNASYDQGIFTQVLWNGLGGHPFESTLSSQLSTNVVHSGELPALGYRRLGQHFTPALITWMPLLGLLGTAALPLVQTGLLTAAGLVLFQLARTQLDERVAARVAFSWFLAQAVIAPMLGNFTDLCQLPLCVFAVLLGIERRRLWLTLIPTLYMPLIREDTGVLLMGIALWCFLRRPHWRLPAVLMGLYGAGWVYAATNLFMPLYSEDVSKRFMVEKFGHYLGEKEEASSAEVLGLVLSQPWKVVQELVSPPGKTIGYLLAQGLPLALVPLISLDAWLLMGLPMLGLLLAQGANDPLSISIRYALLVVPGLFAGGVYWLAGHPGLLARRRFRAIWAGCSTLSLLLALASNPHHALSFLLPDSYQPWLHTSAPAQLRHGQQAFALLDEIPQTDSVSATAMLIPHLARREVALRFPNSIAYRDRQGQEQLVDWIAVDVEQPLREAKAFRKQRQPLRRLIRRLEDARAKDDFGLVACGHGLVLLRHNQPDQPAALAAYQQLLASMPAAVRNNLEPAKEDGNQQNDAPAQAKA